MPKMSLKNRKFVILTLCVILSAAVVGALFVACDRNSAPLPTDTGWTFVSLTVSDETSVKVYYASLGGEYNGMEVNEDMVTAEFTDNRVTLTFANGDELVGGWKKNGESGGASLIEYDFVGEKEVSYGTCGRSVSSDGTEKMSLYVVCGDMSFYFTGA